MLFRSHKIFSYKTFSPETKLLLSISLQPPATFHIPSRPLRLLNPLLLLLGKCALAAPEGEFSFAEGSGLANCAVGHTGLFGSDEEGFFGCACHGSRGEAGDFATLLLLLVMWRPEGIRLVSARMRKRGEKP